MKKVRIKTRSNYRNLNGTLQKVYEVVGDRVTCSIFIEEFGKEVQVDFGKKEVVFV